MSSKGLTCKTDRMKLFMLVVALALCGIVIAVWFDSRLHLAEQIANTVLGAFAIICVGWTAR